MSDCTSLSYCKLDTLMVANMELGEAHAEIERLRAALNRAANALEFYGNKAEAQKARRALEPKS